MRRNGQRKLPARGRVVAAARYPPADPSVCGWFETASPRVRPALQLMGFQEADCAVIGAGFSGLAIARRLSQIRPQWKTVILEAQEVGEASSGRSSGFVVDLVDFMVDLPASSCETLLQVARSGIEELRNLVDENSIDCAWDDRGWIRAAATEEGQRALDKWPERLDAWNIRFEPRNRQELEEITGTSHYRKGIQFPGCPLVQSASLVRGLFDALPESVEVYEHSPVLEIRKARRFELVTSDGSVAADRIFLATNGYTPNLRILERAVLPVYTFASLTRTLTAAEQAELGGLSEWGILATDFMGSTLRRTRDQRILVRNTLHYTKKSPLEQALIDRVEPHLREAFSSRFPNLSDVEFEYSWSGLTGTSMNRAPVFGEIEEGQFAAAAYSGAGIASATALGRMLADLSAGVDSRLLRAVRSLPALPKIPPEPFRSIGARWTMARMNSRAQASL